MNAPEDLTRDELIAVLRYEREQTAKVFSLLKRIEQLIDGLTMSGWHYTLAAMPAGDVIILRALINGQVR